jgi:hypothetical protein
MKKNQFRNIIMEGVRRDKRLLMVKIKGVNDYNPRVVIIQNEDITPTVNRYLKSTDDRMVFKDTGDQILDALMTNNVNDLSWFLY